MRPSQIWFLVFPIAATLNPDIALADKFSLAKHQRQLVFEKLVDLNDFYADVPTSTTCRHPKSPGERLVCQSGDLQLMELLYVRSAAYAEENATKTMVNHQAFSASVPKSCKTETCVADFFRRAADAALGGESPYANMQEKQ